MNQVTDFAETFRQLAAAGVSEQTVQQGGVNVRCVRLPGGGEGRWDRHDATTETVVLWHGDFTVEFRDRTLRLTAGQCCVIPVGVEHRGTSTSGAEVILFQQAF